MKFVFGLLLVIASLNSYSQTKSEAIKKINALLKKVEGETYEAEGYDEPYTVKIDKQTIAATSFEEKYTISSSSSANFSENISFESCTLYGPNRSTSKTVVGILFIFEKKFARNVLIDGHFRKLGDDGEAISLYVYPDDLKFIIMEMQVLAGKQLKYRPL